MKTKIINNKRSQGHIEMILSFVIFAGFVLSIFLFIYPLRQQTVSYAAVDKTQNQVLDYLSFSYPAVSLILNNNLSGTCFSVDDKINVNSSMLVRDLNGNLKKASKQGSKLYLENTPGVRYYKIYLSDTFNNYSIADMGDCISLSDENYSFGVLNTEEYVLYENIQQLNSSYMENYNSLKSSLKIDNNFDFIVLNNSRGIMFNESISVHKLKNVNVLAREIPLKAINKDAAFSDIILHLEVW